jgi:hypothetical protein
VFLQKNELECLNESDHTVNNALSQGSDKYLESDCDEQLSNKYPAVLFLKVDVDECQQTTARSVSFVILVVVLSSDKFPASCVQ